MPQGAVTEFSQSIHNPSATQTLQNLHSIHFRHQILLEFCIGHGSHNSGAPWKISTERIAMDRCYLNSRWILERLDILFQVIVPVFCYLCVVPDKLPTWGDYSFCPKYIQQYLLRTEIMVVTKGRDWLWKAHLFSKMVYEETHNSPQLRFI